ncbi:hypothetical protein [Flavobacterium sp. H122]|uniref:hypothetical protein n=1 Tax=Flavobacterium sp. H122 TaxID=2529860 RepID=UPI0010AB040A|nr:hypothetical protein [Flavobacterium sp. H122]
MFLKENIIKENKTTSLYEAEDTITFQLGENSYSSKGTYQLHLDRSRLYSNQIILNRSNFKIDDREVEKKFAKISSLYFSSVFPLILTHHQGNYHIAEYKETAKRIMENDVAMQNKYNGDGLEYIREQFLDKVKNQTGFQKFIEQLPFYQVLNISAHPKFKKEQVGFKWNVAGLGVIEGTGEFRLNAEENKAVFILMQTDTAHIMQLIENYTVENEMVLTFNESEIPEISFKMTTVYDHSYSNIQNSRAELLISIGEKFKYTQNFYLTLD